MEYWFYHLEKAKPEAILAQLLEKCLEKGWNCLVRAQNDETLEMLDKYLWTYKAEAFLPHAIESDKIEPSEQAILLTKLIENNNFAEALFLLEDAPLGDIEGLERTFYLIDGNNEESLSKARLEYKRAKTEGFNVSYWQQNENGKWEKKA